MADDVAALVVWCSSFRLPLGAENASVIASVEIRGSRSFDP